MTETPLLILGSARAAYVGPGFDLTPHFNVAFTVVFALDQELEIRLWHPKTGWGETRKSNVALIPSQTLHHMKCRGRMMFVYFDPRCDDVSSLTHSKVNAAWSGLVNLDPDSFSLGAVVDLIGIQQKQRASSRINRVLELLESSPHEFHTMEHAAKVACLSASRFRVLFAKQIGVPFRRYRLWRRMAMVVQALQAGQSLTEATLQAGFCDSAHLSASFKDMFGISPNVLLDRGVKIRHECGVRSVVV